MIRALAGTLAVLGPAALCTAQELPEIPPDLPPEVRAQLEAMMKQLQAGGEDAQPDQAEKPAISAPGEKAKDLSDEEAIARFQQVLQRRPFHGPAFKGLVEDYVKRGKMAELIAEYTGRVAALPDDVSLKIVLARLHLRVGGATSAAAVLDGTDRLPADMSRQNSELLVLKAEIYQKTGDNANAERVLKEAQGLATSISESLRLAEALADLHLREGRQAEALAALEDLAGKFPENYMHQKQLATAMTQRGLHEGAMKRYSAMLALTANEVDRRCEVLREMGMAQEKLGKREDAITSYVEAIGLLASDHWLQRELHDRVVTLYRAANRLEDLAAYCAAQIQRAPEQTSMRVLLADVQGAMGKMDLAKQTLAEAAELFPKDVALSQKRVDFLERAGDTPAVGAEYQRIIGQHPEDSELYISYGQFLANNHQVEGARAQWKHVLGTKVEDASLALRLGALFEAYELYDDAGEAYERAVAVSPKQPDPYIALSRMWLLRADPEKASAALDRLGEANPDDAGVQAALAQALRNLGKVEGALAAIERACEIAPDQVKYHQTRSELLVQNGQLERALEVRRALIDKITNPVQQGEAINTLVSMHASANTLAGLVEAEQAALSSGPAGTVRLLILARAADTQRDFPAMRTALNQLLAIEPGHEAGLTQLAKLQDVTGDIDAAVATYTKLIQLHPARARQFYEAMVDVKLRYGDRAGAVTTLESMAQADPANVATLAAVAEQLVRMDEADRALPYFERALRAQPDRHESRLEYGKALVQAGRMEQALSEFKAVALQRTDTDRAGEALVKLHDVATQLGSLEELMDELHAQVELDPQNTLVARVLAQLLVHELEYERAMELLDLVLLHNPRDADLALARAELLRRLAKFEEAAEGYQRVLRFPQIDRDYVLGELGKTYFESGQVDQARRLWRQVQHKMYAGSLLKNNGLLDDAIAVLEEGIRLKPDDFALHRNLVAALESAGKTAEALAAAGRLLDLEPGNTLNIEKLAAAHVRNGDRAGAAAVAARLFSAGVAEDKTKNTGGYGSYASAMYQSAYSSYYGGYGYGYGGSARTNLERGVNFFLQNGLVAELEEALNTQVKEQPDNAVLKQTAADLLGSQLNKPEAGLALLRELETATFPIEHQDWLGSSSQRDYLRVKQYNLIASKPALRDAELARLEGKPAESLTRDELMELAIIRKAQGNTDSAVELLTRVITADPADTLALGVISDLLVGAEKYRDAEPHVRKLIELLGAQRDQMQAGTVDRLRREFVRTLPLELQLRVTESLLSDIADKRTMGAGWSWYGETTQAPGYLRAKLTLATICAETDRMDEARRVWQELAPSRGPDVDRWTMLGDTAQLHKQEDLGFEFYSKGLAAAKQVIGDPLLQQVYTSSTSQGWYGEDATIDKAFGSIVESFSKRGQLVQLYDFLRDTNQESKAKRLAEQYKLSDQLKTLYAARVDEAAKVFKASTESPLKASVPYFAQACKLAELYDREGNWEGAQQVYERYCADFPDELGLLQTLGEVAQARQRNDEAIAWEKKVLECKTRLATRAREWSQRDLSLTPSRPQPLAAGRSNPWTWSQRWGSNRYGYYGYGGGGQGQLERWPSWMRLAQLYIAENNHIAAADAMQRGVGEATSRRDAVVRQASDLIQQRQLTNKMLPVLRTLAVYAPGDERVQLAFSDSLEASGRKDLAAEVCNRLLRRGLSDLGVLSEVKRRLATLNPDAASAETTLASLEAEVATHPENTKLRLRLAKAYYYSLDVDRAADVLATLAAEAPHLEDVHELLVEVYTLQGQNDKLIEAIRAQIERTTKDDERRRARWRLVDELLAAGKNEEALATVKELGDPRDPHSYTRIGTLLQYFGRYDEAIACLEKSKASARGRQYGGGEADFSVPAAMVAKGDFAGAAAKIMESVAEQSRQQVQYGGAYGMFENGGNPFQPIEHIFALYPQLAEEVSKNLAAQRTAAPADPQLFKLEMALNKSLGRPDKSEAMLEKMVEGGGSDQSLVSQQIDMALRRKDFAGAISLAEKFISQQPKPKPTPGMPAQYAGYAALQSPRTFMLCKLGDVYWDMGEKDKAFECYKQIVDDKIDQTQIAYATICIIRGRTDEARKIVDDALAASQVRPPQLLQLRAGIEALEGKADAAFDAIAEAAQHQPDDSDPYAFRGGGSPVYLLSGLARTCGMTDRFATFLRERIQKNPLDWESYSQLAYTYWEAGRPDDALAVLEEAGKQPSLAQQVLTLKLQWLRRTAPLEELIAMTERSVELSEKNVDSTDGRMYGGYYQYDDYRSSPRDELGTLLWERGDRDRAVQVWTERSNSQQAETFARLGALYLRQEAFDEAEKAFVRAVELAPDDTSNRLSLATQLFARGDLKAMLPHMLEVFVQNVTDDDSRRYDYRTYDDEPQDMNRWAAAMLADPSITEILAGADRAEDYRVMLCALTGQWDELEALLGARIAKGSHDPVTWAYWAKVQQRKGDWSQAATALEYLKRAKLTTIAQHRDRLKLVLAGKQFKEAAAGTRQANPAAQQQPSPGGQYTGSYYSRYSYWGGAQGSDLLPSIYIKLGDAGRAERSYLISEGGDGVQGKLPQLASLMWDQQARDRALELMRLALISSSDRYGGSRNLLPRYAGMLAESGKVQEAVDLLIRTYRWDSTGEENSMYASMYGWAPAETIEQGQGEMLGRALYELLTKHGLFDETLQRLANESAQNPKDPRLAQLVISLQKRAGHWADLRQSLAGWKAARPDDLPVKLEEFHAACQLQAWDDALKMLGEIRKDAPERSERWMLHEAFVHFMKDDLDKAVEALEPILQGERGEDGEDASAEMLLLCMNRLDRVIQTMEAQLASGELEAERRPMLFRLYGLAGKRTEAFALAVGEIWKQSDVLDPDGAWYRSLAGLLTDGIAPTPSRPADAALVTLLTQGAPAGKRAFEDVLKQDPSSIEGLRGLVLSAELAGDDAAALDANSRLLDVLGGRRNSLWYTEPTTPLQHLARRAVKERGRYGTVRVTTDAYGGDWFSQTLTGQDQEPAARLLDPVYTSYATLHRKLLARAGKTEDLATLARTHQRTLTEGYPDYQNQAYYGGFAALGAYQPMALYRQSYRQYGRYGMDQGFRQDGWRSAVRTALWEAGRPDLLAAEYQRAGARTSSSEWVLAARASAAAGRSADAARLRLQRAEELLAQLAAGDAPDLGASTRDPWRWYYSYDSSTQDAWRIRAALAVMVTQDYVDAEYRSPIEGEADELWELAIVEPPIERKLLDLEKVVVTGWGATRTLDQLVRYYKAKNDPRKVIELVERALEPDAITSCQLLDCYVWACFREHASDKLERVFSEVAKLGNSMRHEVDIARLMALRGAGQDAAADPIESRLLSACVREAPNKHLAPMELFDGPAMQFDNGERYMRNSYYNTGRYRYPRRYRSPMSELTTIRDVAGALGIRYDTVRHDGDVSILAIRGAYQRHGMHDHAVRMLDLEIAQAANDNERRSLLDAKASEQYLAGRKQEAYRTAAALLEDLDAQIKQHPGVASLRIAQAKVYMSKAFGEDYAKAAAALDAARKIDPSCDQDSLLTVHCLYKLDKHREAFDAWRAARRSGSPNTHGVCYGAPTLFYAALSAASAGETDMAGSLAREALQMYPIHALAGRVKELAK